MRSRRFAVVSFDLTTREPWSVGDPLRLDVTERIAKALAPQAPDEIAVTVPVAQDPQHRAVVRGTSVFGVLRAHLARYELAPTISLRMRGIDSRDPGRRWVRPATLADLLCGSEPEELLPPDPDSGGGNAAKESKESKDEAALRPSALRLVHAELGPSRIDDGPARTAVSRDRGTAVAHKLFRRARIHDTGIEVLLQVDLPILQAQLTAWGLGGPGTGAAVDDLVTVIRAWRPFIGGGVGTGTGTATVGNLHRGLADPLPLRTLLTAETTLDLMRSVLSRAAPVLPLRCCRDAPTADTWHLELPLVCIDPLLIAPRPAPDAGRENRAVTSETVPGSSWRGLFRSRAEFILRSCGVEACPSSDRTCGDCPTCTLFGWAPTPDDPPERQGATGLVRFRDSTVSGEHLEYTHAPIDRFTGGAADAKLFERGSWRPGATLTLTVEQVSTQRPVPEWARHLLALVARDLHDGLIGVGNSTTRGYGTVALSDPAALPAVTPGWSDTIEPRDTPATAGATT